jgi:hypothetical protein
MCGTDVKDYIIRIIEALKHKAWGRVKIPPGIVRWSAHIRVERNPYLEKHVNRTA